MENLRYNTEEQFEIVRKLEGKEERKVVRAALRQGGELVYVGSFAGDHESEMRHQATLDSVDEFGGDSIKYIEAENTDNVWALIESAQVEDFWKLVSSNVRAMQMAE